MLFGHIAVGLAAKPVVPKASLGALLLSATAIDVLCGVFVMTGIENLDASGASSIPWSHGLFMAVVWAIAGTVLAFLVISVCLARSGGGDHPSVWLLVGWGTLAVLLCIAGVFTMFKGAK